MAAATKKDIFDVLSEFYEKILEPCFHRIEKRLDAHDQNFEKISSAEKGGVDFIITCDDTIVKLYERNIGTVKVKVVDILKFLAEEVK